MREERPIVRECVATLYGEVLGSRALKLYALGTTAAGAAVGAVTGYPIEGALIGAAAGPLSVFGAKFLMGYIEESLGSMFR